MGSLDDPLGAEPVAHEAQSPLGAADVKPACSTTAAVEHAEQLEHGVAAAQASQGVLAKAAVVVQALQGAGANAHVVHAGADTTGAETTGEITAGRNTVVGITGMKVVWATGCCNGAKAVTKDAGAGAKPTVTG
jgi:hypothetical protein